jgi:hypothetical protein
MFLYDNDMPDHGGGYELWSATRHHFESTFLNTASTGIRRCSGNTSALPDPRSSLVSTHSSTEIDSGRFTFGWIIRDYLIIRSKVINTSSLDNTGSTRSPASVACTISRAIISPCALVSLKQNEL